MNKNKQRSCVSCQCYQILISIFTNKEWLLGDIFWLMTRHKACGGLTFVLLHLFSFIWIYMDRPEVIFEYFAVLIVNNWNMLFFACNVNHDIDNRFNSIYQQTLHFSIEHVIYVYSVWRKNDHFVFNCIDILDV